MAYTNIPNESKTQVNKAGKFLSENQILTKKNIDEYFQAQDLANRWRACHAYPLNTFQATLRTKLIGYQGSPIVAQRLKRMPTVIDKLARHPNMKLTTMQDIGGVRAIVEDINDVYSIVSKYVDNKNFPHELIEPYYDYIKNPRDEDGYRSIHLVYKYKNKVNPAFDGLRVEIQIRTKLQHVWATAVETMGTFIGQALKTRQGDKEWLDFFALVSHAFSQKEKTSPISRFKELNVRETHKLIALEEKKIGILDKMKGFSYVVKSTGDKAYSYHLIIINNNESEITVFPYDRDSYQNAVADYDSYESKQEANVDVVLVSAGPIETLKKAYPNLFLDLSEFQIVLASIVNKGNIFLDLDA